MMPPEELPSAEVGEIGAAAPAEVSRATARSYLPQAALAGAVIVLSFSPFFIRWAQAPGPVVATYRLLIAALVLTPAVIHRARRGLLPPLAAWRPALVGGVFTALDLGTWASSIQHTSVANATLLGNISPLWVVLFAVLVWKELIDRRFVIGVVVVLLGAFAVLGDTLSLRPDHLLGDVLALVSSVAYAGYFLATERGRARLDTVSLLWAISLVAGILLLIFCPAAGMPLLGYTPHTYLIFLLTALVSQLGGYLFMTYALGSLPASLVTPTMVASPVITSLLAIPLAGEGLSLPQVVGAVCVLGGVYLVNTSRRKAATPSAFTP